MRGNGDNSGELFVLILVSLSVHFRLDEDALDPRLVVAPHSISVQWRGVTNVEDYRIRSGMNLHGLSP
jgi:hypothetical protein